jgi:DNA-binding HxlR family transcriptional regulator
MELAESKVRTIKSNSYMPRRSYDQYCGLARALDVLGERWTLLIVRNLLLGPQRYSELLRGLPGITTNLLAKRLQEMEAEGVIERTGVAGDAASAYRLTELGRSLEPAIHALGRWGWRRMSKPTAKDRRSLEWLLVTLRSRYRGGVTLSASIDADGAPYHIVLRDTRAEIGRGPAPGADLTLRGKGVDVARLFLEGDTPAEIEVEGAARQLRTLVSAFTREDLSGA